MDDFAAQDEQGQWVWRFRATQTKLIYYRPSLKRHWPHPYLERVEAQHYVLPTLKDLWEGDSRAPEYVANRRIVLQRAAGQCERCGQRTRLVVHHRNRRHYGRRRMAYSDNRPEMMEALCKTCHDQEHHAEIVANDKARARAARNE